jgi:hypothetical protein
MRGYSLNVALFRIFLAFIVIMTFGLCLGNAGVSTSCYVPMEGQCSLNIQISMFGLCAIWGKVAHGLFFTELIRNKIKLHTKFCAGQGQGSQYSDSLGVGQSGDRILVKGRDFRTCPDRPCGPPSLLYNGYRVSFPVIKRPGWGVYNPPPSPPN